MVLYKSKPLTEIVFDEGLCSSCFAKVCELDRVLVLLICAISNINVIKGTTIFLQAAQI